MSADNIHHSLRHLSLIFRVKIVKLWIDFTCSKLCLCILRSITIAHNILFVFYVNCKRHTFLYLYNYKYWSAAICFRNNNLNN